MRLAHELTTKSIEQGKAKKHSLQEESIGGQHDGEDFASVADVKPSHPSNGAIAVNDSNIVDALLYSNLVMRCRFTFRARIDPRRRIQVLTACLQLSRETRSLMCTCGNHENATIRTVRGAYEAKYDRNHSVLDQLPSFEEPQPPPSIADSCPCVGIRELLAMEAVLLTDLGYACCDTSDWLTAEYHYLESLRLQQEVLGWSEHVQVAEVLNQLGICLSTRCDYGAYSVWLHQHAERLLKGSLSMRRRLLGQKKPEYATSLNNLANFYQKRAHTHEWSPSQSSVCSSLIKNGKSRSVSKRNPEREGDRVAWLPIDHVNNEIDCTSEQPDIEGMYRLSLKIREATLGEIHPQVAESVNNLALFLSSKLDVCLKYVKKTSDVCNAIYTWTLTRPLCYSLASSNIRRCMTKSKDCILGHCLFAEAHLGMQASRQRLR